MLFVGNFKQNQVFPITPTIKSDRAKEKDDLNIPGQQKRPIAKPLSEIAAQHKDRNTVIIAAYKTGAYSQREIGEFYQLHPTTIGVIVRNNKNT